MSLGVATFDDGGGIPWFAITDPTITEHFGRGMWDSIGLPAGSTPGMVLDALSGRWPNVPDLVINEKNLQNLANAVTLHDFRRDIKKSYAAGSVYMRPRDGDGPGPRDPEEPPPNPTPTPETAGSGQGSLSTIYIGIVVPTPSDAVQAAKCLILQAQWKVHWWGFVEICMDRPCTDALQKVLAAVGIGSFSAGVSAAISQIAAGTAMKAFMTSIGGWVGLALAHFGTYWFWMIDLNVTANGVCIFHRMPWAWWIPPQLHGWAVGR
jgi:hypothetical protein